MAETKQNHRLTETGLHPPSRFEPRRLSNATAEKADLYSVPAIVFPPSGMDFPTNDEETAHDLELAKHHLAVDPNNLTPPPSTGAATPEPGQLPTTDNYAYAFDIDGVLIRGGEVIPEAIEAIKMLNGHNQYNIKV